MKQRGRCVSSCVLALLALLGFASAASTATITGRVIDSSNALIPKAKVDGMNIATNITYSTETNSEGIYVLNNLPPGRYRLFVSKEGFQTMVKPDVVLHVQDVVSISFSMELGPINQSINVEGGAPLNQTESAAVATLVDRQFIENLPLNGRSFQSLIALTPGVVLTKASSGELGQFSINGQRANANYFMVDGVSANVGISPGPKTGQSAGGGLPGLTILGGTNNLVSVDALQEFKIMTSSYAPEFGRTPGGQVSIVTRSGTNQFRGTLFEYFRNDVLDANDWFSNSRGQKRPALRQNLFGGVLGGPLYLPHFGEGSRHFYDGRNRTFFFFSYEGLRLRLPQSKNVIVPSLASRQAAPTSLQPFLNTYPVPNGRVFSNGGAEFAASYSDPSTLNATSIRVDHTLNNKLAMFGRYTYAPSDSVQRYHNALSSLSNMISAKVKTQTLTVGATQSFTPSISNDFRINYSRADGSSFYLFDNFGGAVPPADSVLFPSFASNRTSRLLFLITGVSSLYAGRIGDNVQRQGNLVDNLSFTTGSHQLRFGVDYRRLSPTSGVSEYVQTVRFASIGVTSPGTPAPARSILSGKPANFNIASSDSIRYLYTNFSAYGQDTWQVAQRLTLTYGLRWEMNPAPTGMGGKELFTLALPGDPAAAIFSPNGASLAPQGTPLYQTKYNNFAPRAGVSYQLSTQKGRETVLRGGFGAFYDVGSGFGNDANSNFPYARNKFLPSGTTFPLADPTLGQAPAFSLTPSDDSVIYVYDPDLKLPCTYQWNITLEQSLGSNQTVSASYVAAVGRRLLRHEYLYNTSPTAGFSGVYLTSNAATSDYNALQLQLQRRLSRGFQALLSYTWSKSLDTASSDSFALTPSARIDQRQDRGPSDFDLRHLFSAALTYNLPAPTVGKAASAILSNWSIDTILSARSATPVNIYNSRDLGLELSLGRPDLVPGVPLYLDDPAAPGGKRFNNTPVVTAPGKPAQIGPFLIPAETRQGTLGRNALRGFPIHQVDLALRRQFNLREHLTLQFRAEAFNLFNHPNFADPVSNLDSSQFGQSIGMFGRSLGSGGASGGLSPIYQSGGPRSMQFALRLQF